MSRRINVNPGQYKVAGRERQGENIVHDKNKAAVAKSRVQDRVEPRKRQGTKKAGSHR